MYGTFKVSCYAYGGTTATPIRFLDLFALACMTFGELFFLCVQMYLISFVVVVVLFKHVLDKEGREQTSYERTAGYLISQYTVTCLCLFDIGDVLIVVRHVLSDKQHIYLCKQLKSPILVLKSLHGNPCLFSNQRITNFNV